MKRALALSTRCLCHELYHYEYADDGGKRGKKEDDTNSVLECRKPEAGTPRIKTCFAFFWQIRASRQFERSRLGLRLARHRGRLRIKGECIRCGYIDRSWVNIFYTYFELEINIFFCYRSSCVLKS